MQFKEGNAVENNKYPQSLHLTIETSNGYLYFVDSADNTKVYKTIDKGITVTQVDIDPNDVSGDNKSRLTKIQAMWYDRTNERIYMIDCDNNFLADQFLYCCYIDLSNDSVIELGSKES